MGKLVTLHCLVVSGLLCACTTPKSDTAAAQLAAADDAENDASLATAPTLHPIVFALANPAPTSIYINLTKGWGRAIHAFSGQRRNDQPMLLFDIPCIELCDAPPDKICQRCVAHMGSPQLDPTYFIKEIEAGAVLEVGWDGLAFKPEPAAGTDGGGRVRCNCIRPAEPEPGPYTFEVCGSRSADDDVPYDCPTAALILPVNSATRVEFIFAPSKPGVFDGSTQK